MLSCNPKTPKFSLLYLQICTVNNFPEVFLSLSLKTTILVLNVYFTSSPAKPKKTLIIGNEKNMK